MTTEELNFAMLKWRKIFNDMGLPFLLYQSVCLGLVRNRELLPERVMEFAVLGDDLTDHLYDRMVTEGKMICENGHHTPHGLMYFDDCEIQPVYFKNGKAVFNLRGDDCLVYSEALFKHENWSTVRYMSLSWAIPGNTEQYLTEAYGFDWRVPHEKWSWETNAPNRTTWDKI